MELTRQNHIEKKNSNSTMVPSSQQALLIPEWLKWLQTSDINAKFPTSCGTNTKMAVSCPKLFILTNLSSMHVLYSNATSWTQVEPSSGDFSAFIKTFDRITNEKNFTEKIGGKYFLSTGTYICEGKWRATYNKPLTTHFNETVDQCISHVSVEGPHLSMMKEHIRSGNPPRLIDEKHYNYKSQDGISATNITTEHIQEASRYACEHGAQNNQGIEWYSALVSMIARKKKIPIVDAWNLTKSEVDALEQLEVAGVASRRRLYARTAVVCAATKDGMHFRSGTMWKQLRQW